MKKILFLFAFLILASGCTTILKNPNFEKRSKEFQAFSVVSPDVEIRLVVFTGDDKILYEEGKAASKTVVWAVTQEFEKRGYEVKPLELTEAILQKDPELGPALNRLKEHYASVVEDIHEHHAGVFGDKVLKLTLGEEVNAFADLTGADALIFAKAIGIKKSGSEMAKEWFKSALIMGATFGSVLVVPQNAAGHIDISIVDADNGEILWHNYSPQDRAYNLTENEDIVGMVGKAIKKYPKRVAKRPKVEVLEEVEKVVEGKPTKVVVPLEAAKLTAKTGVMAGEATVDVTAAILKGTATATTTASKQVVHLLTLGATRTQKGETDQAIRLYEQAITLERENPYPYILLGDAYFRKGDLDQAEKYLRQAIKIDPSIPESERLLTEVLSRKGKP